MTVWLRDADQLDLPDGALAIDTEFHAENRFHPRLHLIQVRAQEGPAYLIDAHDAELVARVAPDLTSRPWIVHAGWVDLPLLRATLGRIPDQVFDTQIAAGLVSARYPTGLATLLDTHLGLKLDKHEQLSDWSRRPLSAQQQAYAAADVLHLHALHARLLSSLDPLGRSAIAEAACRWAASRALEGPDDDELASAVPGSAHLDARGYATLQKLTRWRHDRAASEDRPVHTVLPNRTLLDLAKRQPTHVGELVAGRTSPRKQLERHGTALVRAILDARQAPPPHRPVLRPGTREHARLLWIQAACASWALKGSWAARLVTPDALLTAWLLDPALDLGWRDALVGAPLRQAAEGSIQLAIP